MLGLADIQRNRPLVRIGLGAFQQRVELLEGVGLETVETRIQGVKVRSGQKRGQVRSGSIYPDQHERFTKLR